MRKADLLKRIEELEARVRELEARPPMVQWIPYPQPTIQPVYIERRYEVGPWRYWEGPYCGTAIGASMSGTTTLAPHSIG